MASTGIRKRVAIVGAGAGGLVVCHRLSTSTSLEVTVFEQTDSVGGTWVYTERTGDDPITGLPIHSSMYRNLRTNLPKESMPFLDFPFPADGPSFISSAEVLKYLNDYCDHYKLRNLIHFKTYVKRVDPVARNGEQVWKVRVEDLELNREEEHEYDAIAVCNGHYSVPRRSNLCGLERFGGRVMHSHDYRIPDPFAGRTVACLGGGPSGIDIAIELRQSANKVYLCQNGTFPFKYPPDLHLKAFPSSCERDGLVFGDGETCPVDDVILCTGYDYVYPFLGDACGVTVADNCVAPLYKQLFNSKHPSMALFGVPRAIIPFPFMDVQAQVFRKVVEGTLSLPSASEMDADIERQMAAALDGGRQPRHFHKMGPEEMRRYLDDLTDFGKLETPVPRVVHKLFLNHKNTIRDLTTYRETNYGVTGDDDFYVRT